MKKYLLFFFSFSFLSANIFAQLTRTKPALFKSPAAIVHESKTGNEQIAIPKTSYLKAAASSPSYGDTIGYTWYDYQTNGSMQKRINLDSSGNIRVVWTKSLDTILDSGNLLRGIGYNYYDRATQIWNPGDSNNAPYGIAEKKVGWPTIVPLEGPDEAIFAHTDRLYTSTKQQSNVSWFNLGGGKLHDATGITFYHTAAEGNSIYVCYSLSSKFYFGKSDDQGVTWSLSDVSLDSICGTPFNPMVSESYDLDAKGDTVAIIAGGYTAFISNEPNDVVLYLSYDRGLNWSCQTLHKFDTINALPDPNSNGYQVETPSADVRVLIGSDGRIHCTGSVLAALTNSGTLSSNSWFPLTRGIWYWNSDMSGSFDINDSIDYSNYVLVDSIPDLTTLGRYPTSAGEMGNYETGVFSHPSLSEDQYGNLFIVFSGVCAGSDNGLLENKYKRDLFLMETIDGGSTWAQAKNMASLLSVNDVTDGTSGEEVYPVAPKRFESMLPILFQYDSWAGSTLIDNQSILEENKMVVLFFDPYLSVGFKDEYSNSNFNLYPNPAFGTVTLSVKSKDANQAHVYISNLIGQELFNDPIELQKGNNVIQLDIKSLVRGIYLVTLGSGENKYTQKLVIE